MSTCHCCYQLWWSCPYAFDVVSSPWLSGSEATWPSQLGDELSLPLFLLGVDALFPLLSCGLSSPIWASDPAVCPGTECSPPDNNIPDQNKLSWVKRWFFIFCLANNYSTRTRSCWREEHFYCHDHISSLSFSRDQYLVSKENSIELNILAILEDGALNISLPKGVEKLTFIANIGFRIIPSSFLWPCAKRNNFLQISLRSSITLNVMTKNSHFLKIICFWQDFLEFKLSQTFDQLNYNKAWIHVYIPVTKQPRELWAPQRTSDRIPIA